MIEFFKSELLFCFKQKRTVVYYLGIAIALFAILSGLSYYFYDYGDKTFADEAVVLMVLGGVLYLLLVTLLPFQFVPMIPAILYTAAFGYALTATLPSLSDVWNGVNFIGGFAFMGLFYTIRFFLCAVFSIVSCFFSYRKPKREKAGA